MEHDWKIIYKKKKNCSISYVVCERWDVDDELMIWSENDEESSFKSEAGLVDERKMKCFVNFIHSSLVLLCVAKSPECFRLIYDLNEWPSSHEAVENSAEYTFLRGFKLSQ